VCKYPYTVQIMRSYISCEHAAIPALRVLQCDLLRANYLAWFIFFQNTRQLLRRKGLRRKAPFANPLSALTFLLRCS